MSHILGLHDKDFHHSSESVGHKVSANYKTLQDLMNNTFADLRQIFFDCFGIVDSLHRSHASARHLLLKIKKLLCVELYLKGLLGGIVMLIDQ